VIVRMRRRSPAEYVEPFRRRLVEQEGHALHARIALWAKAVGPELVGVVPDMPEGVVDRDADVWEALLAVADAAGGEWPKRARVAAVALVADSKRSTPSLGLRLLADMQTVFGDVDVMSSEEICRRLCALDESPWGDLRGKPIDQRALANRLRQYGVESKVVRIGDRTPRGYARADFHDAWTRYLLSPLSNKSATSATTATEAF